ncbi:hypothetical protein [Aporhodopirellula aestuarii]|uniref:Organic solvent tolerance-like N-terminal domain-containing protein n=1 Tax=Aporhodopirellula aestuarii TaxID=2950107 RepID=A0ABT0U8H3_9BACT|nr:hypothetical protein [Aporhodopirellula aestuarii]MCM2373214.1 hypothetical protein [Aporhodopirellula aestuarii]
MAGSFRDYIIGLSLVLVAMGGYQVTAAKWLTPPEIEHAPIAVRVLSDNDESLADLYPEDAWQRGRAIRLKTQDGMLLFQNWEQNKDDRDGGKKWRLWPITMVIGRGLSADDSREPILIEAAEGAVIEFSAALDVMSGVAPTIQRGQLLGDVHIQRVASHQPTQTTGNNDPEADSAYHVRPTQTELSDDQTLDIRTANVGIDRRKIWTTEAIEMHVGRAVMVGRDLTLHLAASTGTATSQANLARSLDRMELIYLRELTLPLGKPQDAWSPDDDNRGMVQVHCDGRIEYDFAMDQLLLDRNVRLVHQATTDTRSAGNSDPSLFDQFECDSLRMTLRDPLNSDRIRKTAIDWIDRIEATGRPVRLSVRSQQFDLTAGQVLFDPLEGWLIAGPSPVGAMPLATSVGGDPRLTEFVRLRRGEMQATLSRIVYRFDPKHPQQLGTVEVDGKGRVDYSSIDSVFKSFSWRDSLRVSPLETATADAMNVRFGVWCDGDIRSLLADGGTFQTDRIEGVLKPVVQRSPNSRAHTANNASGTDDASLDHSWFPDRFSAIGNVRVNSSTLQASTPQMNLFFEQAAPAAKNAVVPRDGSSLRQWVSQPDAGTLNNGRNVAAANGVAKPAKPPATIRGDQVTAKLTFGDGELTATDLSVVGNVEVTHSLTLRQKTSANSNPETDQPTQTMLAVMTGDHLRLRDGDGGGDVLQLGSQSQTPARLELGDGYFIGPEIQVRPDDNYIWIPSAGEFVVPSAFLPALGGVASSRDPAKAMRWTQSPRGRFGGSMTFDGRVATLSGGVVLEAAIAQGREPSDLRMQGDKLSFTLETPVDLRTPATFQATQLAQISLKQTSQQPVEIFVDRFAADGRRESRHEMLLSELTWIPGATTENGTAASLTTYPMNQSRQVASPLAGQVYAPGAGSYRGWIRTTAKQSDEADKTAIKTRGIADNGADASVYFEGMIEDQQGAFDRQNQGAGNSPPETYITGVHLVFQDGMQGDLMAKSLTFRRGIRIGRKIVEDFDSRFDATDMNLLSEDELTLDCDQIRLAIDPSAAVQQSRFSADTGGSSPAFEIEASGGIVFRSRTDRGLSEATADRCGYAVAKDLVTIEGTPGRPARFQQTPLTGRPVTLAIINMTLRLKPFELVSSKVESLSTGMRPAMTSSNR